MSELESMLNYLETTSMEPHDDYTSEFSYKEQKVLWKYIKELQQKNEELKKQLSNDHQIKMKRLQQENRELKQQLSNSHQMENQQKEFIEYLENEMILFQEYMKEIECSDRCHGDYPITYYTSKCRLNEVTEILSKYKEIIGGNNDQ